MAKLELKVDTTEFMGKIEILREKLQVLTLKMIDVKQAADGASQAVRDFSAACENIKVSL